jgi:polyisoprenoid-binding protein YceI
VFVKTQVSTRQDPVSGLLRQYAAVCHRAVAPEGFDFMRKALTLALLAPMALIACATASATAPTSATAGTAAPTIADPAKAANLAEQPAGIYEIEPTHTSVTWRISHSGLSTYTARFDKISGEIDFKPQAPTTSTATIMIDPNSVNTGLPEFDKKIAKDVFKAEATPMIIFKSTGLTATSATTGTMTGDLTIAGVTKPMTLNVAYNTGRMSPFARRQNIGFSATGSIRRSEWGMTNWMSVGGIGDNVDLIIEAEFLKKAS